LSERAALLAKADLVSGVVGEFPELQGTMGRYYAIEDGEHPDVAEAIREHYSPIGPTDRTPTRPVSICVAIADKADTLGQLWIAGEKPTGSGDPYALRRAALGIIRIIIENDLRLSLRRLFEISEFTFAERQEGLQGASKIDDLLSFFADRLKVALREKGVRHDLIDAVFALGNEDDLVRLVRRVEALQAFLKSDDGANLLTGYRRAANIRRIEEKKDKKEYRGLPAGLKQDEEIALQSALTHAKVDAAKALSSEDFEGAMKALASLRVPVDRFFDKVTVNTDDENLRENRLKLLSQIVETAHQVADFSKIEG
jgi:glycyl-tRNA synthetase beta chain